METELLHQRENWEEGEQHLKDNGQKFSRHCNIVLGLMYKGMRLTARQLEREYNIDGRRLRDIFANRKECKKAWRTQKIKEIEVGEDGIAAEVERIKNIEMEYWLDIPPYPTKQSVIEKAHEAMDAIKKVESTLVTILTLPDDPPNYSQGNLF